MAAQEKDRLDLYDGFEAGKDAFRILTCRTTEIR